MTDIGDLIGIGPKTASWLREVDIHTEADLRALGAVDAYRRLKHRFPERASLNALWGLHAAILGIPWTAVDREAKERLLADLGPIAGTRSPSRDSARGRRPSSPEP